MICTTQVKFLGRNGTEEDLKEASKHLTVGHVYQVSEIHIGSWRTEILLGMCKVPFNSVMFKGVGRKI